MFQHESCPFCELDFSIYARLEDIQKVKNKEVLPNFGHPYPNFSFTKYNFL